MTSNKVEDKSIKLTNIFTTKSACYDLLPRLLQMCAGKVHMLLKEDISLVELVEQGLLQYWT